MHLSIKIHAVALLAFTLASMTVMTVSASPMPMNAHDHGHGRSHGENHPSQGRKRRHPSPPTPPALIKASSSEYGSDTDDASSVITERQGSSAIANGQSNVMRDQPLFKLYKEYKHSAHTAVTALTLDDGTAHGIPQSILIKQYNDNDKKHAISVWRYLTKRLQKALDGQVEPLTDNTEDTSDELDKDNGIALRTLLSIPDIHQNLITSLRPTSRGSSGQKDYPSHPTTVMSTARELRQQLRILFKITTSHHSGPPPHVAPRDRAPLLQKDNFNGLSLVDQAIVRSNLIRELIMLSDDMIMVSNKFQTGSFDATEVISFLNHLPNAQSIHPSFEDIKDVWVRGKGYDLTSSYETLRTNAHNNRAVEAEVRRSEGLQELSESLLNCALDHGVDLAKVLTKVSRAHRNFSKEIGRNRH
ncbi:hypothetical protein BJ684DRAFT_19942 [Piptocephalis cylindrospora]|uniref:Uncharacterized protein n=1 Tax=Piptocephalis cylindrospora TaxID=1907219 RepID=A0A4P9Y4B1_9FUNG|nr:hypothetical protein BJ684DRAFT_19942 [Piptocephalis cylindrospora]|eukprot:RKP13574.1 hypothetical protein BJ684DRAFT_19942 [Piptocephalis cylindrospora]